MSLSYTLTEQKLVKLLGETNILIQSIDRTKINTIYPTYILQKRPLFETLYEDFLLEVRSAEEEEKNAEKNGEEDVKKDGEKDGEKDDVENNPISKDENENTENNPNFNESTENNKPDSSGHSKTLYIFTGNEPILRGLSGKSPALKTDFQRLFSIIKYYQRENIPTAKEWIEVLFDGDEDGKDSIRSRGGKGASSIVRKFRRKLGKLLGINDGNAN